MPKTVKTLNGIWRLTGKGSDGITSIDIEADVPGHVHNDLLNAGLIQDPFWRDQADLCQWVEDKQWTYSREFDIDPDFIKDWTQIEFQGLDTYTTIILNGKVLAETDNMFVPHCFDVSSFIKPGKNSIEVSFKPVAEGVGDKPVADYPSCFSSDRVYTRRMQCTYSWDWVHRFVSYGIWQPVALKSFDSAGIDDLFVYTSSVNETSAAIKMELEVSSKKDENIKASVEISDPDGICVWKDDLGIVDGVNRFYADLPNPKLWWPAGYGDQPLYSAKAVLTGADGRELDNKIESFGIRTVRLEQIHDEPGSDAAKLTEKIRSQGFDRSGDIPGRSYTFIINGRRIFCKGGNWVPCDPFPGRIEADRYDRLIKLVRDGNMNCLRSWGGGIYEPEAFWKACDKYGVMITQDFLMACARYPESDPDFMDQLREEFPKAVKMLRNHPSLILWAGDNELAMGADFDDPDSWGKKVADEISGPLCRQMDPSRPFSPTSPFGGRPNNCQTIGDVHLSAWYDPAFITGRLDNYRIKIQETIGRFISESAVPGAPPMRSLLKFMSPEDIADPEGMMWNYHTKDNPYNGIDDPYMTHYRMLEHTAYELFGETDDPEEKVARMEYAHYEWIRLQVETARRNKWYCGGLLFWMYNDCWPASGWSVVDYYGFPKAGWYAMKNRCKNIIASIEELEDEYRVWVCSDLLLPAKGTIALSIQNWTGEFLWQQDKIIFDICENSSKIAASISKSQLNGLLAKDSILVCDLESASGCDRAYLYPKMPKEMDLPKAGLSISQKSAGSNGEIEIKAENYARVVTLDADLDFSDNYFDLLPGETRIVTWSNPAGETINPEIKVTCWNE